jgi:uncharacterized protein YbaR (Trm112 family)
MSVIVNCFGCPARVRVREEMLGDVVRCSQCKSTFVVERGADGLTHIRPVSTSAMSPPPTPPQRAYRVPPPPPPIVVNIPLPAVERNEIQEVPFLVDDGAVVECPHCERRTLVKERDFGEEIVCKQCEGTFRVSVRDDRQIQFQCPSCLQTLLVPKEMGGEEVQCARYVCGYFPVPVPPSPVRVKKLKDGRVVPRRNFYFPPPPPPAPVARPAPSQPPSYEWGGDDSPEPCYICRQRYPRNPTGVCWKCQRR